MIRVLHIYPQMNNAGTEMVIMNLYKNIDRTKVQFDFCVQEKGLLDNTIRDMGGTIYYLNKDTYFQDLNKLFCNHPEYQIIHTHTHAEMGKELEIANRNHIKVRIAHSHNSRADLPKIIKLYKVFTSRKIEKYSTHKIACSEEAAKWLYPLTHKKAEIWNNGIDLKKFCYSDDARRKIRIQLKIPYDAKVICHVGRFARQKNHEFLIELLNKLVQKDQKMYGLLVGCGPLQEEMKNKASSDKIIFLGNRTDVPDIMSASDCFVFPSLWEGLGIVAVEAQASGLMCIASERVPLSADLGIDRFKTINLSESVDYWANQICNSMRLIGDRKNISSDNYDIKVISRKVQEFYLSCADN